MRVTRRFQPPRSVAWYTDTAATKMHVFWSCSTRDGTALLLVSLHSATASSASWAGGEVHHCASRPARVSRCRTTS